MLIDLGGVVYLLDAGLHPALLLRRLASCGVSPQQVGGIVISHEHLDHARGALNLSQAFGIPLYTLAGTGRQMGMEANKFVALSPSRPNHVDGLLVQPVPVSHDAAQPCGFILSDGKKTLGYFTDLGTCDERVREFMGEADLLILEANHDDHMLWSGPYPYRLKSRIAGPMGHLSNRQAVEVLEHLPRLPKVVVLGHLSAINNRPELVLREVTRTFGGRRLSVLVLPRKSMGPWVAVP
jgi:phosphoribosyl 1,2-cyclic phosphodiesterase